MRVLPALAVAMACAAVPFHSTTAQTPQAWSAQGSLLYSGLSGDAYRGFNAGPGFEAQLRYTTTLGVSVGVGYQYTTHGIDGASGDASLSGPFVEPRYTFELKGRENVFPYASVRVSRLEQKISTNGIESSASGYTANVGGGVLFHVATRVTLDVGATFGLTSFSDFVLVNPSTGQRIAGGATGSGTNFVLRTGIQIGLF